MSEGTEHDHTPLSRRGFQCPTEEDRSGSKKSRLV